MINFSSYRKLYEVTPTFLKHCVRVVPFKYIAGKEYRHTVSAIAKYRKSSSTDLLRKQEELLGRTLGYAVRNIPAYMHLAGVIKELRPFEAIHSFPIIDKEFVQNNFDSMTPCKLDAKDYYLSSTGGTSGNQLKIVNDNNSHYRETAFIHEMWHSKTGYKPSNRKATFRGVSFSNTNFNKCFWQVNPIYNELQFSPFHMHADNLEKYIRKLIKYKPEYLHGYPSAIGMLAKFMSENHTESPLKFLKGILLGSESLDEQQFRDIINLTGVDAFTWYGQSERIILAEKCKKSFSYSPNPLYGFTEIVEPSDDQENRLAGGELVGTSFYNFAMPLIRYRTGDLASYTKIVCDCCWCDTKIKNIYGRWSQDYILGHNKAKITSTALNMHGDMFENVVRYQYVQTKIGVVDIKLMVNKDFNELDLEKIRNAYGNKLTNAINFRLKVVEDIPLTPRGKLKLIHRSAECDE